MVLRVAWIKAHYIPQVALVWPGDKVATREGGLGGTVKMNNCSYFSFIYINKNEGEEIIDISSSFTGPLTTISLQVETCKHMFTLLSVTCLMNIGAHGRTQTWSLSSNPITPQTCAWVHADTCTYSVLHILASCALHIISIRSKRHRCGPGKHKILRARHSTPYPCSTLHGDRLPESLQVLQQWPL